MLVYLKRSYLLQSCRHYSTNPLDASIFISESTSPYFNLTLEDWLFRKTPPERPLLLLYRNHPCVIIGRNQNPWKEINFPALNALGIPFVRRRSGGGTVYHDLGNTNFSIHLPRNQFHRRHTTELVQSALISLGIKAEINGRNDICVDGFKVSGSAYKIVNVRAYHHGTMLLSTELRNLGDALRNTKETMVTKGVASVKSPVNNINQFNSDVSHSSFMDAVMRKFKERYSVGEDPYIVQNDDSMKSTEYIRDGISELQSWDWQYGQTPEFTHAMTGKFWWGSLTVNITSKNGLILSCRISSDNPELQTWCQGLANKIVNQRYSFLEGIEIELRTEEVRRTNEVLLWLQDNM